MFVIISKKELRMLAAAHQRTHIHLIMEIDFPDTDCIICNAHDGGSWSCFTREDMDTLYKNTSGMTEAPEYGEAIEQLRAYVLTWSDYHKSEAELQIERAELLDNGDIPADDPIQRQIAANKAMREAQQATIAAVEQANGAHDAKPEVIAAKAEEAAKKPARPVAAPTQGVTKRVWEIADAVYGANPGAMLKEVRKKTMELAHEEGINPGTAATQYGRWKSERGYA